MRRRVGTLQHRAHPLESLESSKVHHPSKDVAGNGQLVLADLVGVFADDAGAVGLDELEKARVRSISLQA